MVWVWLWCFRTLLWNFKSVQESTSRNPSSTVFRSEKQHWKHKKWRFDWPSCKLLFSKRNPEWNALISLPWHRDISLSIMNQQVFVAYLVDTLLLEAEEAKKRHLDLETKAEKLEAGTFPASGRLVCWFMPERRKRVPVGRSKNNMKYMMCVKFWNL